MFLEVIIKGTVSIFYYKDDAKEYYFASKDSIFIELNHHETAINTSGNNISRSSKSKKYIGQLKLLLQEQPSLFKSIEKITCNKEDLIYIVKEYQKLNCPTQDCI